MNQHERGDFFSSTLTPSFKPWTTFFFKGTRRAKAVWVTHLHLIKWQLVKFNFRWNINLVWEIDCNLLSDINSQGKLNFFLNNAFLRKKKFYRNYFQDKPLQCFIKRPPYPVLRAACTAACRLHNNVNKPIKCEVFKRVYRDKPHISSTQFDLALLLLLRTGCTW